MELECFTLFDPDSLFLYLSSKFKNIQIKALYQKLLQLNPDFTSIQPQNHPDSTQIKLISFVINSKYGLLAPVYIIYFQTNVCRL